MDERPNCIHCVHYYVTHDPRQPYGCRRFGFKSTQNPAILVFSSSGVECQSFRRKENPSGSTQSGKGFFA